MKRLKLILPSLAFVLAIGLAFAIEHKAPGDLVLEIDGVLYNSPIDCDGSGQNCTAQILKDGAVQEFQVLRETATGDYEPEETSAPNNTVFPFSSLTPVNP
ncbi:DUF6520 family protein [Sinomicrobium sp. M5D2P17]